MITQLLCVRQDKDHVKKLSQRLILMQKTRRTKTMTRLSWRLTSVRERPSRILLKIGIKLLKLRTQRLREITCFLNVTIPTVKVCLRNHAILEITLESIQVTVLSNVTTVTRTLLRVVTLDVIWPSCTVWNVKITRMN